MSVGTLPIRRTGLVGAITVLATSAPVDLPSAQIRRERRSATVVGTGSTVCAARTTWSTLMYGWLNSAVRARLSVIVICATATSHGFAPDENRRPNWLCTNVTP